MWKWLGWMTNKYIYLLDAWRNRMATLHLPIHMLGSMRVASPQQHERIVSRRLCHSIFLHNCRLSRDDDHSTIFHIKIPPHSFGTHARNYLFGMQVQRWKMQFSTPDIEPTHFTAISTVHCEAWFHSCALRCSWSMYRSTDAVMAATSVVHLAIAIMKLRAQAHGNGTDHYYYKRIVRRLNRQMASHA